MCKIRFELFDFSLVETNEVVDLFSVPATKLSEIVDDLLTLDLLFVHYNINSMI